MPRLRFPALLLVAVHLMHACRHKDSGPTAPPGSPAAPSNLTAERTGLAGSRIRLSWQDNSDDEDQFVVVRLRVSGNEIESSSVLPADTTEWLDEQPLAYDQTYRYVVYAENGLGRSLDSNRVEVTIPRPIGGGIGGGGCVVLMQEPTPGASSLDLWLVSASRGSVITAGTLELEGGALDLDGGPGEYRIGIESVSGHDGEWLRAAMEVRGGPAAVGSVADSCFAFADLALGAVARTTHVDLAGRPSVRLSVPGLPALPMGRGLSLPVAVRVDPARGTFSLRILDAIQLDDLPLRTVVVVSCLWLG